MDNAIGFISIGLLILGNIVGLAFAYGRLTQKQVDIAERVTKLETSVNGRWNKLCEELNRHNGRIIRLETIEDEENKKEVKHE